MKYSIYIQLSCSTCQRVSGAVIIGAIGEEKAIGCKWCGSSAIVFLNDNYQIVKENLKIDLGIYDTNWSS